MPPPVRVPARPRVPLEYLLWDGTDPVDSQALGEGLRRLRWENLLHDSPAGEEFVTPRRPRCFQPAGEHGTDFSLPLWMRGMFEFPRTFLDPMHHNRGDNRPNLLAYSGHGIPGFMFSESMILICSSRPMIGPLDRWSFVLSPQWNHPSLKVVLFSACRQLSGRPQQWLWSQAMRGANPMHMILSYRETAPAASASAGINQRFLGNLQNRQPFVEAWKNAHNTANLSVRWAALCYRTAVNDRLDEWIRSGSLSSRPDPRTEEILYFDNDNGAGRVVQEPTQHLDCWLSPRGNSTRIPPWFLIHPNIQLDLHIEFLPSSHQHFEDGDELWIAAIQVRPDYAGASEQPPHQNFDIRLLFTIDVSPDPLVNGTARVAGRIHNRSHGWSSANEDVYTIRIDRSLGWLNPNATWTHLKIPIRLHSRFNDHLPIFYFMLRVKKTAQRRAFGIPIIMAGGEEIADQDRLIDDFQYAVFVLTP